MLAACTPSRSALFDPVQRDLQRAGLRARWTDGAAPRQELDQLLADPLTAERAGAVALLANPELQAAFEDLAIAGADLAAASAPPGPELEGEAVVHHGDTIYQVGALVDISHLLLTPTRRGAAQRALSAVQHRTARRAVDTAAAARRAFYVAIAAGQSAAMQREMSEAAAAAATLARRLHDARNVSDLALAREEAFAAQAALDVDAANDEATASRERLNVALGLDGTGLSWRADKELPRLPPSPPDTANLEALAVQRSLQLAELRDEEAAAAQRLGAARWALVLPEIAIGAVAEREADGHWGYGPAASLRLPLAEALGGARGRARAEGRAARARGRGHLAEIKASARSAQSRLHAAHRRAVHLRDVVVPLRRRIVDETLLHYNAMNATPFELVAARVEHMAAERQYVEAARDYWLAAVAVDQLLAGSLPDLGASSASTTSFNPGRRAADAH